MHVAAREVEARDRAHEARCKARRTHYFARLRYAVGALVYSLTGHGIGLYLLRHVELTICRETLEISPALKILAPSDSQ